MAPVSDFGGLMVRGCQRKVVFLKNTDSKIFSEAYFIVDDSFLSAGVAEADMVREATRIVNECLGMTDAPSSGGTVFKKILHTVLFSIPGFLVGALLTALLFIIF